MPRAVIEDWEQFEAFLAAQPFCQWSAQRTQEADMRAFSFSAQSVQAPPKDDNAALLAALSSMA